MVYRVLMVCHVEFCYHRGEKVIRDYLFRSEPLFLSWSFLHMLHMHMHLDEYLLNFTGLSLSLRENTLEIFLRSAFSFYITCSTCFMTFYRVRSFLIFLIFALSSSSYDILQSAFFLDFLNRYLPFPPHHMIFHRVRSFLIFLRSAFSSSSNDIL